MVGFFPWWLLAPLMVGSFMLWKASLTLVRTTRESVAQDLGLGLVDHSTASGQSDGMELRIEDLKHLGGVMRRLRRTDLLGPFPLVGGLRSLLWEIGARDDQTGREYHK